MATGLQSQEGVPENLRKQLAFAVKSIQWSYAIFWSISSRQPGVLEWGDGYYNGDIKTRKTVQAVELSADQLGLQRTEQLRGLYESLSAAESNPQARRPSAALSPEDLTDTEWYFLVCMSFVFNIGQGLPGRTLANNQTNWLCNAHYANSKVFSRSLLAKGASIQTVVCFPYLGGVVELGVTELVLEDPNIIQHIKTSFLEIPYPIVTNISKYVSETARTEKDFACDLDHNILDTNLNPVVECERVDIYSPINSSNGFETNQQAEESFMVEGTSGGAFQVQSWKILDDEISNCVHNSMNSSDCISQAFLSPETVFPLSKGEKVNDGCLVDLQECNDMKPTSFDIRNDDIHYQGVLSTLLKSSHQLIMGSCFRNSNNVSSFVSWKKGGSLGIQMSQGGTPQRLLKKVLFEVTRMHGSCLLESREDNGKRDQLWRPEADEIDTQHVVSERKRRGKLNERFLILGSLVPSSGKVDKVSVLDNTIEYLKELEKRVEKLKSNKEVPELEARTRRKPHDIAERTSDNYDDNKIGKSKKLLMNKRKVCDGDEMEAEINQLLVEDNSSTDDLNVSIIEKNVLIEIKCPWRDGLLLEIVDATSNLHLDSHSVQSSNVDGILSLTIKSKLKVSTVASAVMIRKALQRVIRRI